MYNFGLTLNSLFGSCQGVSGCHIYNEKWHAEAVYVTQDLISGHLQYLLLPFVHYKNLVVLTYSLNLSKFVIHRVEIKQMLS